MQDWLEVNQKTPRLVSVLPNGPVHHPTVRVFLAGGVPEILRRNELALLQIHDAAGAAGFGEQIRLAAEERGNLQDVDYLRGGSGLPGLVDIGEHGVSGCLHADKNAQPLG